VTNCESTDIDWAVKEILIVQARNTRSKSEKSFHLVVSFPDAQNRAGCRPAPWPTSCSIIPFRVFAGFSIFACAAAWRSRSTLQHDRNASVSAGGMCCLSRAACRVVSNAALLHSVSLCLCVSVSLCLCVELGRWAAWDSDRPTSHFVTCEAWRPGRAGDPSRGLDQDRRPLRRQVPKRPDI
jgi:hypothetical protein